MARTNEDDNSALEWWALAKILAFVVESVGSKKAAKELLLYYLDRGEIRWRAWKMIHGSTKWTIEAAEYFFWRWHEGTTIKVDWKNGNATRIGPVHEFWAGGVAARVLDDPAVTLEVLLIQLCWNDVRDILQSLGYLPADTPSPSMPASPQSPKEFQLLGVRAEGIAGVVTVEFQSQSKRWDPEDREEWLAQLLKTMPPKKNKKRWVHEVAYPQMREDFGEDDAPWGELGLYRRLFPRKTGRGRGRRKKISLSQKN